MKIKWKIFVITFAKERLKHSKYVTISDREITETVRDLRKKVSLTIQGQSIDGLRFSDEIVKV